MKKIIITTAAALTFASTATAGEKNFQASFSYDASAPIDVTYNSFKTDAKAVCAKELIRAGYRAAESSSFQRRKCERQLVSRAVKAAQNKDLIAYHMNGGTFTAMTRQFASHNSAKK